MDMWIPILGYVLKAVVLVDMVSLYIITEERLRQPTATHVIQVAIHVLGQALTNVKLAIKATIYILETERKLMVLAMLNLVQYLRQFT